MSGTQIIIMVCLMTAASIAFGFILHTKTNTYCIVTETRYVEEKTGMLVQNKYAPDRWLTLPEYKIEINEYRKRQGDKP